MPEMPEVLRNSAGGQIRQGVRPSLRRKVPYRLPPGANRLKLFTTIIYDFS